MDDRGSYNQIDYVYDIAQLLHQKEMSPVTVIGHSRRVYFSLVYRFISKNVNKLISIEGMGPSFCLKTQPADG